MSKRTASSRISTLDVKKIRTRPIKQVSNTTEENVSDEFEPTLSIELPTAAEMRLLEVRSMFPRQKFSTRVPPVVFVHQLYDGRPLTEAIVQKDIERMKSSGKIKLLPLGPDTGIILSADLDEYLSTLDVEKKVGDRVRVMWRDNLIGSVKKSALRSQFRVTDRDVSELIHAGFLVIQNETTYSFSFPGLGEFTKVFYAGRRAILTAIERSKFKELLVSEIERRPFDKTVKLGVKYQLADIIGGNFVSCMGTTSGTLLKHIPREKKRR